MTKIKGIDVSHHQGKILWDKVKKSGISFAFIRCGYCNSNGQITLDDKFEENKNAAKKVGLNIGTYIYSYAESETAAKKAAKSTIKIIQNDHFTYPIVFDIEDEKYRHNASSETIKKNTTLVNTFLKEIESAGYYAMFYTDKNFAETFLNRKQLAQYDFWIARYYSKLEYKDSYGIWQYSSTGSIPGIQGNVDLNISYQDYAAIIKKHKLNHL